MDEDTTEEHVELAHGSKSPLNRLILYFFLAMAITWLFWIPTLMIAAENSYFVPHIGSLYLISQEGFKDNLHVWIYVFNQLGVYGPFLSALITTALFEGKEGLKDLFSRVGKWRVNLKWYAAIIAIPLIISLGTLGLAGLFGANLEHAFNPGIAVSFFFLIFLENTLTSGMEEPGWRGYALPKLNEQHPAYKSSIILGIIWAIWHYPFVFYLYFIQMNSGLFLTILSMAGFTAIMTFGSVIYSWLYLNTKSVFLLILFHALQNFIPYVVSSRVMDPLGGFSTAIITIILVFLIAKKYGEETLTGLTDKEIGEHENK